MYQAARKTIPIIHTGVGIPSGRPIPNQPNRSALSVKPVFTGLPLVYTIVTPRSSSIITSVAINACTRPLATIIPVTAPTAAPNARAAAIATSALTSNPTIEAATAPVSASREPTDRSIPDVRITSVMPTAIMAFTDVCWRILNRLLTVKKFGLMVDTIAISTSSAISDFCSNSHALVK
ncbi:hypothetical protein D3C72_1455170 [compost metagenome]